jgi:hypothetical protein
LDDPVGGPRDAARDHARLTLDTQLNGHTGFADVLDQRGDRGDTRLGLRRVALGI